MLLLTTLTVGGSEDVALFAHLPSDTRGRLQEKAQALLAIDSKKRVTFMVHELKQAMSFKGLRGVERVDPSWIVQGLKGENARVVATILMSLPAPTVRSVLRRLPSGIRNKLPPKEEIKRVPLQLVRAVRQIFESRFAAMPEPSPKGFAFRDVIQLERKELYRLMRALGLTELGQAFATVGKLALAELCRRLPRDKAEELILSVRHASRMDLPDIKTAQRFLSRVVVNFKDTEEFFQKSGLWRLAKATLLEDETFRDGFRQRLPRDAGQLLTTYMEKAAEMEVEDDALRRLQDSVLLRIRELAKSGEIAPRWGSVEMNFYDPSIAEAHAQEPEPEPM
ncbi:MAG: hypothetical protein A2289_02520 [Deltaproteobacteria bacterium RIFOXYA12_FULL_58_15]|nr:MAG: hypothetical protein A2289_02520 [Deltaproteobacteria bacterium RIFOXYA12_FULL_58_15]OGR09254.1 MAG: hypothetical protein A2341_24220 [Deltaproteobacteria bacterium RIFOXYB12_FULL_58_9]